MANTNVKSGNSDSFYFLQLQNHWGLWLQPWNKKMLAPWEESYDKPRQCIKEQRYQFSDEGTYSQTVFFSSSHVWMWDLDHKEGWVLKKWCFQIVVLKKTLESPLDYKENKKVNPKKKINPEYSLERVLLKLKLQHFGHLMWRANSLEKTLMLGKIEGKGEGGGRDKMVSITKWMDLNLSKFGR